MKDSKLNEFIISLLIYIINVLLLQFVLVDAIGWGWSIFTLIVLDSVIWLLVYKLKLVKL